MGWKRKSLGIAANVATVATALATGTSLLYRQVAVRSAWPPWMGKMNWLLVPLAISFAGNVLFWIASRREDAAIAEGEATLFRHYSVCSRKLELSLEMVRHHWADTGQHLTHPLREDERGNGLVSEVEAFRVLYRNHLEWLAFEIPEFDSSGLPPFPSDAEYLEVIRALRLHGKQLDEAATSIGLKDSK